MNRPEYKPELEVSNMLMASITGVQSLVSLSDRYRQDGMYFRGYLDGLPYALAVLSAVASPYEGDIPVFSQGIRLWPDFS